MSDQPVVKFYSQLDPIVYKSRGAAAVDLQTKAEKTIYPGETHVVKTGLWVEIPEGMVGEVSVRSSIGKRGLILANAPGLVDSDYRGEVMLILTNVSKAVIELTYGHRIAQMRFVEAKQAILQEVSSPADLSETQRGSGGLGSTGV